MCSAPWEFHHDWLLVTVDKQEQIARILVYFLFEAAPLELLLHTELARHIEVVFLKLQESWCRPEGFKCNGIVFALALDREFILAERGQLEEEQGSADLENGRGEVCVDTQQVHWALNFDECSKLGPVVLDEEFAILNFEKRMRPTDADVGNFHISLNTAADFKAVIGKVKDVDYFGGRTLDRFKDHVVLFGLVKLHNAEEAGSKFVLKWFLAQLALECLPKVACNPCARIHKPLAMEPLFKARNVDCAH